MVLSGLRSPFSNDANNLSRIDKLPPLIPRRASKDPQATQGSEPPPATPSLPAPIQNTRDHKFSTPVRRIISPHDHDLFLASNSYTLLLAWVFGLSDSVRGLTVSDITKATDQYHSTIKAILRILQEAKDLLDDFPPEDTGSRFGNKVFRDYMQAIEGKSTGWHAYFVQDDSDTDRRIPPEAITELSTYLTNSFGSPSRLDYGSGHELNFACWLLCLQRLGFLTDTTDDRTLASIALAVFPAYWSLMRSVQGAYYLEPAGSHGVWGLDDYQFLPFLFGAAQFVPPTSTSSKPKNSFLTPKAIHSPLLLDDYASEYLYLAQVQHINSVKNVEGLRWHSPMLDDISSAKNWTKIEGGMKKMFVKEVLGKRAVMQHFLFSSLIPAVEGMSPAYDEQAEVGEDAEDGCGQPGHVHDHDHDKSLSDACGIKVPGAVGAAIEARKHGGQAALRRLPFD